MRRLSPLLFLLASLLAAGCSGMVLMKTPAVVDKGGVDPFVDVAPENQNTSAVVFTASGRTVSGHPEPARFYTNKRSREVRLGIATIEIGEGMTWDELVEESRLAHRDRQPRISTTAFEEYGTLWTTAWPPDYRYFGNWDASGVDREPAERFAAAVDSMLDRSRERQITIFVHGFNTRFTDNLGLAAEFWHYMARDGVMISFDWPSQGDLFSYHVDKANAAFAVRQFRELLEFLAAHTSADRINIFAHSAGAPVAAEAVQQLSLMYSTLSDEEARHRSKIGRVVLAAPDMDLDQALTAGVDGAGRLTQGVAVYASQKDAALKFSGGVFGNVRLGRSIGKLTSEERQALIANQSQWIDVTRAQGPFPSLIGHSYFHENPWVSSDLMLFLALGVPPADRGLVRDEKTGFLVFPDDYEGQLPAIVARLRAKAGSSSAE
ncbi:MAG: alpha/beta fold hydrolase [Phycisphaerales bacterium]|nr:alpha/beta fold hydrolase [Phycisphaerales bacterium]